MMDNGHDSDCATHNAPAYPPGPCDCLPTQDMCRAAVMYANGLDVYERSIPGKVLEIEEAIYSEVWKAMQTAAPSVGAWVQFHERGPSIGTECLVLLRYSLDKPPFVAIDTWDEQSEGGHGWNENYESDVIAWLAIPPHPPAE